MLDRRGTSRLSRGRRDSPGWRDGGSPAPPFKNVAQGKDRGLIMHLAHHQASAYKSLERIQSKYKTAERRGILISSRAKDADAGPSTPSLLLESPVQGLTFGVPVATAPLRHIFRVYNEFLSQEGMKKNKIKIVQSRLLATKRYAFGSFCPPLSFLFFKLGFIRTALLVQQGDPPSYPSFHQGARIKMEGLSV